MIRAVVFDCFGVFYTGARSHVVHMAPEKSRRELSDLFNQADYGFITGQQFLEQASALLTIDATELAKIMRQQYVRREPIIALAKRLRQRGYKIGLLSNVNDSLMQQLFSDSERRELFDAVVLSSSVGMIKPEAALYEYMLDRLGVEAQDAVMIDDLAVNVEGARRVGMAGVLCHEYDDLVRDLQELGVDA